MTLLGVHSMAVMWSSPNSYFLHTEIKCFLWSDWWSDIFFMFSKRINNYLFCPLHSNLIFFAAFLIFIQLFSSARQYQVAHLQRTLISVLHKTKLSVLNRAMTQFPCQVWCWSKHCLQFYSISKISGCNVKYPIQGHFH